MTGLHPGAQPYRGSYEPRHDFAALVRYRGSPYPYYLYPTGFTHAATYAARTRIVIRLREAPTPRSHRAKRPTRGASS